MAYNLEQTFGLVNVLSTPIETRISPLVAKEILSQPPFLPIPGALNIRDISVPPFIRNGCIYRSGALGHITLGGKSDLAEKYGIRTIFDLRTFAERAKSPSPDFEGIETRWIASKADLGKGIKIAKDVEPRDFIEDDGKIGFLKMYSNILESYSGVFKTVLLQLRDKTEGGVLFHCTAGKDRTGILAALILGLTGAPPEAIAMDYALTRIGVEPAHEQLLAVLQSQTGFSFDQPGFVEMCSIQSKTMLSFLEMLDERWDGVEGYVKGGLGLEDVDIELIKENLRGKR